MPKLIHATLELSQPSQTRDIEMKTEVRKLKKDDNYQVASCALSACLIHETKTIQSIHETVKRCVKSVRSVEKVYVEKNRPIVYVYITEQDSSVSK